MRYGVHEDHSARGAAVRRAGNGGVMMGDGLRRAKELARGTRAVPSPAQFAVLRAMWGERNASMDAGTARWLLGSRVIDACMALGWIASDSARLYVTGDGWQAMLRRQRKIGSAAMKEGVPAPPSPGQP